MAWVLVPLFFYNMYVGVERLHAFGTRVVCCGAVFLVLRV